MNSFSLEYNSTDKLVDIATRLDDRGSNTNRFKKLYSFPKRSVHTGSGAQPASCSVGTGFFPAGKASWCEVDYSPPHSAHAKNEYSFTCTPSVCVHIVASKQYVTGIFVVKLSKYITAHIRNTLCSCVWAEIRTLNSKVSILRRLYPVIAGHW